MEVFKEASRLAVVSGTTFDRVRMAFYLAIIAEEEANAVIGISPFKELVIWREVEPEWRSTEEPVQFRSVYKGRHPLVALCFASVTSKGGRVVVGTARQRT